MWQARRVAGVGGAGGGGAGGQRGVGGEGGGGYVSFFREGRVGDLFELLDQGVLDREDGVGFDVLAPGGEDVRGQRAVAGGGDDEVDVGRPEGVSAGRLEQLADRA